MDQGREVFAVPGNITSKLSWGPNLLIKQGAKLIQDWNDVVAELSPESRRHLIDKGRQRILARAVNPKAGSGIIIRERRGQQLDATPRKALAGAASGRGHTLGRSLEKVEDISRRADRRSLRVGDARFGPATPRQEFC
jgi:DNA processing protein